MNIVAHYNIYIYAGLAISTLLTILAMRRAPFFSFKNICVLIIFLHALLGVLFLPYSLKMDQFNVVNAQLYESSINKSVLYHISGLLIFLVMLILLDFKKRNYSFSNGKYLEFFSFSEQILYLKSSKILALALPVLLGSVLIYLTFLYTGNVPYCNFVDASAKYFSGFTERYIKIRPFYVFGQQVLAIVGFFLLYFLIKTLKARELGKAAIYLSLFLISSFSLILTMKRGEILLPFTIYIGGLILLNRLKISQIAPIILLLFCLAFILAPSQSRRPLAGLVCGDTLQKISSVSRKTAEPWSITRLKDQVRSINRKAFSFVLNSFCVQVRDSSRLFYNFKQKNESYLHGKTFIAGTFGFIPTSIFPFKEKNQIGRVTLRLFGLDPETSGGPRIGIIGESYINFGISGILIIPGIFGILVWFIDQYYMIIYKKNSGEHQLLHMSFMFIILSHVCAGIYLDGSGALQSFIIRSGIILLIVFSLLPRSKKLSKSNT